MSQVTPGPKLDRSHIAPVTTREELIYLLSRASELEHGLACIYLFAAYSLKNDVSEGGMTEEQTEMVRGWRRQLCLVAVEEMGHLAQVANLLTAIGGAPHFKRTNFPLPPSAFPFGIRLSLEPFSQETIERFVCYEMPETGILLEEKQALFDPIRARVLESHGALQTSLGEEEVDEESYEPFEIDFKTVGEFYHKIETGFTHIPQEELFIGPPEAQANARFVDLNGNLVSVVDQASACAAIEMIIEQGEAPTTAHPDAHFWVFDNIRVQYAEAMIQAEQSGIPFEPVRPVISNPMTRFYDDTSGGIVILDPLTHKVADLFNVVYDTMLLILLRFFAHTEETDAELEHLSRASLRLMTTVIRPLGEALTKMPVDRGALPGKTAGPGFGYNRDIHLLPHKPSAWVFFGERLWQLATAATSLRLHPGIPAEVQEAVAALQDLACQFAPFDGPRGVAAKVAELKAMEIGLGCSIQVSLNGPYLVTNAENLQNSRGERIQARPQMALCRCGGSAIKPFCDGAHARIGFTGKKKLDRVPDRRDIYAGEQVTILDNRGICAHSGLCTDNLAAVFHLGQEPWIDPDGARLEEIIAVVRNCPSGALSYAIGGVERRDEVDQVREPAIVVSKNGPYRITGGIPLEDEQEHDEQRAQGSSREHYSLCRCGQSKNKPFCSGMHWYVNFLYWLLGTSVRLISTVRNGLPFLNRLQIEEGEGKIGSRHTILILLRRSSHVMENVILWVVFSPIFCG
jgi:CDGSH-type Zn-finger protein